MFHLNEKRKDLSILRAQNEENCVLILFFSDFTNLISKEDLTFANDRRYTCITLKSITCLNLAG